MLKKTQNGFMAFFLLEFTKKLIENSKTEEVYKLENILKEKEKQEQEKIKEKIAPRKQVLDKDVMEKIGDVKTLRPRHLIRIKRILRIPEPRLPPHLQYLFPTPTKTEIDLGKINPLIKDPAVREMECDGPDENIIVRGNMWEKKSKIILSQDEIEEIIRIFSNTTKIPAEEGVFRAVYGTLSMSAIISPEIGSSFIIKKILMPRFF